MRSGDRRTTSSPALFSLVGEMVRVSVLDLPASLRPSEVEGAAGCSQGLGGWWSTSLGSLVTIPLSPGWPTSAAATTTTLGGRGGRSRRMVEGILWMTGEGVGVGNSGDPVLGVEGKRSLSSQRPDAEELGERVEHHLILANHPHRQR